MSLRRFVTALFLIPFLLLPAVAWSSTIATNTVVTTQGTLIPGQGITTPAGGPWDHLSFNWLFQGSPIASGALFLLTQEYLGTPGGLSPATAGFLATTSTIAAGVWAFDPQVTLQSNTQYFLYSTLPLTLSGAGANPYSGGNLFAASTSVSEFSPVASQDATFLLQGTPTATAVPEPGTLVLLGAGLVGMFARRLMTRR